MLKRHTQVLTTVLRLLDMSLAFAAWELAYHLRFFWVNLPNALMIPSHSEYLKAAIFVVVLTGFVFSLSGIYSLQKVVRPIKELYHVLKNDCLPADLIFQTQRALQQLKQTRSYGL